MVGDNSSRLPMGKRDSMQNLLSSSSYQSTVSAAHDLAEIPKRVRPDVRPQAEELQGIVTRAHKKLDDLSQVTQEAPALVHSGGRRLTLNRTRNGEIASALTELEVAYQSLRDLRRANKESLAGDAPTHFRA